MTSENMLKFKDGRIWQFYTLPPTSPVAEKMGLRGRGMWRDVTTAIALILKSEFDSPLRMEDVDVCDLDSPDEYMGYICSDDKR